MRALAIAVFVFCAACDVSVGKGGVQANGGYTVDIRANGDDQIYQVIAPNGHSVAVQVDKGRSTLLDQASLQRALAAMPAPAPPTSNTTASDGSGDVSINAPGFSMRAHGDGDAANGKDNNNQGSGSVSIQAGGFGMQVEGNDDGTGNGRAHVHLSGLSEADARRFIDDAHEISPETKAQMFGALGLH